MTTIFTGYIYANYQESISVLYNEAAIKYGSKPVLINGTSYNTGSLVTVNSSDILTFSLYSGDNTPDYTSGAKGITQFNGLLVDLLGTPITFTYKPNVNNAPPPITANVDGTISNNDQFDLSFNLNENISITFNVTHLTPEQQSSFFTAGGPTSISQWLSISGGLLFTSTQTAISSTSSTPDGSYTLNLVLDTSINSPFSTASSTNQLTNALNTSFPFQNLGTCAAQVTLIQN